MMRLTIEGLTKSYKGKAALSINHLSFESGVIYGITGRNGSGKTTLLKAIAGITKYDAGMISVIGYDGQFHRETTYLSASPYIFDRTVLENIAYPLKIRGIPVKQAYDMSRDIALKLGIEDLLDKNGKEISTGESQKTAMARAIVFKPRILLIDEATSNMDPEIFKLVAEMIKSFARENDSIVLYVSHHREQVEWLCDETINLDTLNGKEH